MAPQPVGARDGTLTRVPPPRAMLYVVRFHDRADRLAVRERWLAAHIAWVAARRDRVLVAGSLRVAPGDAPVGGLWIVEAENRAEVEAIVATDPFWTEGLRERVEIWHWSKALPEPATV